MKRQTLAFIALLCLTLGVSSCSLFKEKCDCPKFNYTSPTQPDELPELECA